MFAYIDKTDKYGITHRNYFLTQGDSCTLTANDDGRNIISKVLFKLNTIGESEYDLIEFFRKEYRLSDDGEWCLFLTSDDTNAIEITGDNDPYVYEIEVYFIDGSVETVEQANFTIWKQGKKEGEDA